MRTHEQCFRDWNNMGLVLPIELPWILSFSTEECLDFDSKIEGIGSESEIG